MTNAFIVAGIIASIIVVAVFVGYAGGNYSGFTTLNTIQSTYNLSDTAVDTSSATFGIGSAIKNGFAFIGGALSFQIGDLEGSTVPVWVNLLIWCVFLALIWIVLEFIRGV